LISSSKYGKLVLLGSVKATLTPKTGQGVEHPLSHQLVSRTYMFLWSRSSLYS